MKINKDTKLFFSLSSNPGTFGSIIYNHFFEKFKINSIYKPLSCNKDNFVKVIDSFREVGVSGISVSMPFKKMAFKYCQDRDSSSEVGNCNTLLLNNNQYKCYNTDYYGFEQSCALYLSMAKTATIVGNGALSDTIEQVLKSRKIDYIKTKTPEYIEESDFLINATPIGMSHVPDTLFTEELVSRHKFVFDAVVSKETNLTKICKKIDKDFVNGLAMSTYQLKKQFGIYTGIDIPSYLIIKKVQEIYYE